MLKTLSKRARFIQILALMGIFLLAACTSTGGSEPEVEDVSTDVVVEDSSEDVEEAEPEPEVESEADEESMEEPTAVPEEESSEESEAVEESAEDLEEPTAEPVEEPEAEPEGDTIVLEDGTVIFTTDDRSSRLVSLTSSWNTNWNLRTISTADIWWQRFLACNLLTPFF